MIGGPRVVFGFTITDGKIVAIDLTTDPEHIRRLDLKIAVGPNSSDLVGAYSAVPHPNRPTAGRPNLPAA